MRHRLVHTAILACLVATALPAHAGDAVTDAIQASYPAYRVALFRTNSGAQPESRQAIDKAQQAWQAMMDRFGNQPPAPYDRDADFGATTKQVAAVYQQAAQEIAAGQLPLAHETLEKARDLIAAIRQRNGVIVFSDHMNAYHAQMEHLLIEGPAMLAGPQGLQRVTAQVGVLGYLVGQLAEQGPAALKNEAEFGNLLTDVQASVTALMDAAVAADVPALKRAIGEVKKPYSKLFLKFG